MLCSKIKKLLADFIIKMTKTFTPKRRLFVVLFISVLALLTWFGVSKVQPNKTAAPSQAPKVYQAVVYDVATWQAAQKQKTPDDKALLLLLGDGATESEALDFYGAKAKEYRFASLTEPMLSVIVSDELFEVHWYHAVAKDTDSDKAVSVAYAKKAYQLLGVVYGLDVSFMQDLLDSKDVKRAGVVFAKCQMYRCQIVLDKAQSHIKSTLTKTDTKG